VVVIYQNTKGAIIMSEKYDKSVKVIKLKHTELNALVDAAIEKGEKMNEADIMRISKELDLLINQYMESISDTDTCSFITCCNIKVAYFIS
jgi:hypothetical protein